MYETLLVDCKVSFHPEFDPGYYAVVLEEEIKNSSAPGLTAKDRTLCSAASCML